jgi:hypothetical protein
VPEAPAGALPWQAAMTDIKKRSDLKTIMIIGAGPIVIGQACEFDYSGTQACKALRQEGYRVVLLNSNPATIMTDPGMADRTYVGPMTPDLVEQILAAERPDAILPTMGGQTGLNLAKALAESGILEKYGVELIGAKLPSIDRAEDRELFKQAMTRIGLKTPPSGTASSVEEAIVIAGQIGRFPLIIRPAFTLGGTGGGISYNMEEFKAQVQVRENDVGVVVCLFVLFLFFGGRRRGRCCFLRRRCLFWQRGSEREQGRASLSPRALRKRGERQHHLSLARAAPPSPLFLSRRPSPPPSLSRFHQPAKTKTNN